MNVCSDVRFAVVVNSFILLRTTCLKTLVPLGYCVMKSHAVSMISTTAFRFCKPRKFLTSAKRSRIKFINSCLDSVFLFAGLIVNYQQRMLEDQQSICLAHDRTQNHNEASITDSACVNNKMMQLIWACHLNSIVLKCAGNYFVYLSNTLRQRLTFVTPFGMMKMN